MIEHWGQREVAVIVGATGGIGRAIAHGLAATGAALCLVGRRREAVKDLAERFHREGRSAQAYHADLTMEEDIGNLASAMMESVGGIDVLVHAAGALSRGPIGSAAVEDFDRQYHVNVRGPYLLTQKLLPLLSSRSGQVVFINSTVGLKAQAGVAQYAATKHALKAVADALRDEVNAYGIRVLSVFVGRTATAMQAAVHAAEGRAYEPDLLLQPEDVAAMVMAALGLPRTAEVTEMTVRPLRKLT